MYTFLNWIWPPQILGASGSNQIAPDVAAGPNGKVYIVWADNSRGQYEIEFVVNTKNGQDGFWTAPSQLTDSARDSLSPRIAIGLATWKVGVVWRDFRDQNWEVYFTAKFI